MSKSSLAEFYRFVRPMNAPLIARLDKFYFELSELFSITDIAGCISACCRQFVCVCGGGDYHTRDTVSVRSREYTRVWKREAVD